METRDSVPSTTPLPYAYSPLPAADAASAEVSGSANGRRRPLCAAALVLSAALLLLAVAALAGVRIAPPRPIAVGETAAAARSRGPAAGVSEKTSGASGVLLGEGGGNAFPWSNAMLQWQRTGFHFQPQKNWMNDPNGKPRFLTDSFIDFLNFSL